MLREVFLVLFAWLSVLAQANTEIRNFAASAEKKIADFDAEFSGRTLDAAHNKQSFAVLPAALSTPLKSVCDDSLHIAGSSGNGILSSLCPHELWVLLDLDDPQWAKFSMFTIRLSWPAFVRTIVHVIKTNFVC